MAVYRVEFSYKRTVVTHIEADSADDIHDFIEDNEDWNILDDAPEMVDDDFSVIDVDSDEGDYAVMPCDDVTAIYGIREGLIVEVDGEDG